MIYDDEFFESLPVDKFLAGKMLCERFLNFHKRTIKPAKSTLHYYSDFIDSYAALEAFLVSKDFAYEDPLLSKLSDNKYQNMETILGEFTKYHTGFDQQLTEDEYESARNKYKGLFQNTFVYKFTDGDLKRIQTLINELRDSISESELFDEKHRQRLLMKLEELQKGLHKKVTSLDKFWGLIGEAGIVFGKFGNDVKPLVDRIREITEIIWRTQANAEELPSGIKLPFLKAKNEE